MASMRKLYKEYDLRLSYFDANAEYGNMQSILIMEKIFLFNVINFYG